MTSNINIISADITIFDDLTVFGRNCYTDATAGPSYQHFGISVNIKGISIVM